VKCFHRVLPVSEYLEGKRASEKQAEEEDEGKVLSFNSQHAAPAVQSECE
jgi:hypothetical protein